MATAIPSNSNEVWQVSPMQRYLSTSRKDSVAQRTRLLARALRTTGMQLRKDDSAVASYLEIGAAHVDSLASYLSSASLKTVARDFKKLAQEKPGWVVAGTFALGFVARGLIKGGVATPDGGHAGAPSSFVAA